jgi:hypothetical protein
MNDPFHYFHSALRIQHATQHAGMITWYAWQPNKKSVLFILFIYHPHFKLYICR